MKRIVNTTATADVGYIEKLPYRRPPDNVKDAVEGTVDQIVEALKANPDADVSELRSEIDELIFDLFEIGQSRDLVREFYETVGKVEAEPDEPDGAVQAATE